MAPPEREFLKRVMKNFGLETDSALMPTYGQDITEELAQLPEATKWEVLDLVIQAAIADGQVVPAERAYINVIAQQLGVSDEDIGERFKRAFS